MNLNIVTRLKTHLPQIMGIFNGVTMHRPAMTPKPTGVSVGSYKSITAHYPRTNDTFVNASQSEKDAIRAEIESMTSGIKSRAIDIQELRNIALTKERHYRHAKFPTTPQTYRELVASKLALSGAQKAQELAKKSLAQKLTPPSDFNLTTNLFDHRTNSRI